MYFEKQVFSQESENNGPLFDRGECENENENELSSTNESSNSLNLGLLQNNDMNYSFNNDLSKIIFFEYHHLEEEEKKEKIENELYFFEDKEKQNDTLETNNLFKKRGRGNKDSFTSSSRKNDKKAHDKYSTDNLLRKIQVHYLSFIISFVNDILKNLNYKQRFLKLDYQFKKNINKKFFDSLKGKTIKEIICNKISNKYKNQSKDTNKIIYEEIKNDKILNNLLSENYLNLFRKIYYKNSEYINLKEYGLDKDILLSKEVKIFKDLIEAFDSNEEKDYKKNIIKCAIKNYLPNSLFLLS